MKPDPLPPEVPYLSLPPDYHLARPQPFDWHRLGVALLILAYLAAVGWGVYRITHKQAVPAPAVEAGDDCPYPVKLSRIKTPTITTP